MRFVVVLALCLAALLSLTSASAIRRGTVTNSHSVTVVQTNNALLSLMPSVGGGNIAQVAYLSGGLLHLDFTRGHNSSSYGFPANNGLGPSRLDKFRYRGLFQVTNRSPWSQCISVFVPGGGVGDLSGVFIRSGSDTGDGTRVASPGGARFGCVWVGADASVNVDFWWEIQSGTTGTNPFNVRAEGTRTP